jgi:hypothetical protein
VSPHVLDGQPRGPHGREQRDLDDEAPRGLLGGVELAGPLPGGLADVVEQDVDPTEALPDRHEGLPHRTPVGPVRGDGQHLPARRLDLPGHRVQGVALAIDHGEVGALPGQA